MRVHGGYAFGGNIPLYHLRVQLSFRPMAGKFDSSYQRITWACDQMRELKRRSLLYFNPETHRRFKEADPETLHTLDKIELDPIPEPIIRNVVQIIEGLRCALDHA